MRVALILLTILFITGCRKKDDISPSVIIEQPLEMSTHNYGDFINIKATISDNKVVSFVTASILDQNFNQVLKKVEQENNTSKLSFEANIYVDDIYLNSGQYYIKVTASDGNKSESEYRSIKLVIPPKKVKQVLFVQKPASHFQLMSLDSSGSIQTEYNVGLEFLDFAANSRHQVIAVSGTENEVFRILETGTWNSVWSDIPTPNPPFDYYTSLKLTNSDDFYFGTSTGQKYIRAYNGSLKTVSNEMEPGYHSQESVLSGPFLFVDEYNPGLNKHYIAKYSRSSGSYSSKFFVDFDVVEMFSLEADEFIIFGNSGASSIFTLMDFFGNSNQQTLELNGLINDIVQVDEDTYIAALSTGIHRFDRITSNSTLINTMNANNLAYNEVSGTFYAIDSTSLVQMNLSGAVISSFAVNAGKSVEILYNK